MLFCQLIQCLIDIIRKDEIILLLIYPFFFGLFLSPALLNFFNTQLFSFSIPFGFIKKREDVTEVVEGFCGGNARRLIFIKPIPGRRASARFIFLLEPGENGTTLRMDFSQYASQLSIFASVLVFVSLVISAYLILRGS